jgi:acyl dehydratase
MQFGSCFEEFEIGVVYKHWPGRTITEYDDILFCMLTLNHHPLHIDANYAEHTQFKQRVVVGTLVFSIVLGMTVEDVSGKAIANLEFENVKHIAPTFHGDTIYAETTVLDKRLSSSKPERGVVTVETLAYNQHGETVLSFKRRVLVPTRVYDETRQREWEEKMAVIRQKGQQA